MNKKILDELTEELENMGHDTRSAEVWYALGGELYDAGHIAEAETAFRQAINLDPGDA